MTDDYDEKDPKMGSFANVKIMGCEECNPPLGANGWIEQIEVREAGSISEARLILTEDVAGDGDLFDRLKKEHPKDNVFVSVRNCPNCRPDYKPGPVKDWERLSDEAKDRIARKQARESVKKTEQAEIFGSGRDGRDD